jgi:hypothetical protein
MRHVARWCSRFAEVSSAALRANAREIVFVSGLLLTSYGLSLVSQAAAFIVPGSILIWLAIPPVMRSK